MTFQKKGQLIHCILGNKLKFIQRIVHSKEHTFDSLERLNAYEDQYANSVFFST